MRQVKLQKKINNATLKAKELGIMNDNPKVKGKGENLPYQPTKSSNMSATRFKENEMKVSNPKTNEVKGYNTPFGGGSGPKKGDMKPSSSYKNTNK
jgi:hypothetical protein